MTERNISLHRSIVVIATLMTTIAVFAQTPENRSALPARDSIQVKHSTAETTQPTDTISTDNQSVASQKSTKKNKKRATKKGAETLSIKGDPGFTPQKRYKVEGGVLIEITPSLGDALLAKDSLPHTSVALGDTSLLPLKSDALPKDEPQKAKKGNKRSDRDTLADSARTRYSALFRDTIPLSRMTAISLVVPGFSQLYNKQAWKIPILYGVSGGLAALGFQQNNRYKQIKSHYNELVAQKAPQETIDPVQSAMIRHNTAQTALFAGAIATYLYFLCDGVLNYQGPPNPVKKATTLSTLCPGAGQLYNRSYWKVPIVVGAFATMGFVIDWNARGYNKYRKAYNAVINGEEATIDGQANPYSADQLKTMKDNFRRNRDLAIILTCALYALNIVDAHVDAHFKDFDISDDLAVKLEPTLFQFATNTKYVNGVGLALRVNF